MADVALSGTCKSPCRTRAWTVRELIMLYLSQMLGKPVVDCTGEKIGTVSDLAISTGEVFPRITSLAFQGPGKIPFMISWRKYVDEFDDDGLTL